MVRLGCCKYGFFDGVGVSNRGDIEVTRLPNLRNDVSEFGCGRKAEIKVEHVAGKCVVCKKRGCVKFESALLKADMKLGGIRISILESKFMFEHL